MPGKWDGFMSRDCPVILQSDSLVYGSEMWNDWMSRLDAFVRKRRHLCLIRLCYEARHNGSVRETDFLEAGTVVLIERVEGWHLWVTLINWSICCNAGGRKLWAFASGGLNEMWLCNTGLHKVKKGVDTVEVVGQGLSQWLSQFYLFYWSHFNVDLR